MSLFNLRNVLPVVVAFVFGLSTVLSVGSVAAPAAPVTFSTTEVVEEVAAAEPLEEVVEEALPVEEAPAEEPAAVVEEAPEASIDDPVGVGEVLGESVEEAPVPEEEAAPEAVVEESSEGTSSAEEASAPAATAAELTTEEADYHPGETATIIGKLFGSLQEIVLKIFGSDDNNENYVESTQTVTTDAEGNFTATYTLDDLYRPFYEMTASALDGTLLASGWFRDAAVDIYDQCSNDDGDGYATGDTGCRWINGAINGNNSVYQEGDSTVQRLSIEGFEPGTEHTVTIQYGTTKQGKHAYDFLTTYNDSEDWVTVVDRCDGIGGCTTASETTFPIPNDTNGSGQFQGTVGPRNFTIRGGTITNVTAPSLSGSYAGDSETSMTLTIEVDEADGEMCSTKGQVTSCGIALFFGAHVAKGADWTAFNGTTGAGSINGSPYHVAITELDGGSIGNRDNQMQAGSVPELASITLLKTVVNNNGGSAADTDWTLAANGPTPISGVEGAAAVTAAVVEPGQYTLSESGGPAGYVGSTYSCVKNGGAPVVSNSITLAAGDDAICTITNDDQQAYITVVKEVTNDNGGDAQPNDFNLTLEGNAVSSGVAVPVNPGTYTAAETLLPGYSFEGFSGDCDSAGDVTVALGQSKTCTLTNDDIAPVLHLRKVVTNDNGGTATVANFTLTANGAGANDLSGTSPVDSGAGLKADTFALSETNVSGYTASAWSCVGGTQNGASITLGLGQEATCTITNDDQPGHLIVHKVTVPASDTTTQFSITASGGTIVSPAATQSIVGGGSVDYTVHAGTYSVNEADLAGWDETSNTCADVVVANGETEECTITNTKRGTIVIVKDAIPNHVQDFSFTGSGSIGNFLLDDDGDVNNALPKQRSFEVAPGEYSVTESGTAGWEFDGATCSDGSSADAIDVAPGETVTCTFTNEKLASITLVKNTIGGDADFDFDGTGAGLPADIDLSTVAGTATQTFDNLDPDNTYSITENVPAGWVLTGASCTGTNTPGDITPNAGENVTCTFSNSKPDAYIEIDPLEAINPITEAHVFTVTVTQVPNGATPAATANITRDVSPVPNITNTTTCGPAVAFVGNVATCTITINSSTVGDFVANATAALAIGGVVLERSTDGTGDNSGSATKTYKAGALEVTKVVAGLAGVVNGNTVDDTFTVTVTGPSYPGGHQIVFTLTNGVLESSNPVVLENLIPGNYTITEADAGAEWTETVPENAVVVVIDETAKATVTNTYVPGALEVSKVVDLNNYLFPQGVDTSFTFEVTGPSYPVAEEVVINVVDGVPAGAQTLTNLIPGEYVVNEVGEDTLAWTASGEGAVSVSAGATAQKAVTNSLKIPSTDISITPSVYETEPGQNVVLTITDTNNGETPITDPSVELYANNVLTVPQPTYVSGDANTNDVLDIGETWTWSVALLINGNTTFVVNGLGTDPLGNPVNGPTYASETDSVVVRTIGATRTIGFWQTHTNFTTDMFEDYLVPADKNFVGVNAAVVPGSHKGTLAGIGQVFGGFYAPIAKTTSGAKRIPVDQARVTMLQQLLAAKLNCAAFGCSSATQTLIANADAAYAAGNKAAIMSLSAQLDAFNNSGDVNAIPAGLPATGKATPKDSQSLADKAFWNQP